jgi:hypothetical protein
MSTKDWMKHGYQELYDQALTVYNYISKEPNRTRLGFGATTPGGIFLDNVFGGDLSKYEAILLIYKDPEKRTSVLIRKLKEAKKILEASFRTLYSSYINHNTSVTDDDRLAMDLPLHDTVPTPVLKPTSWPIPQLDTSVQRKITIHFTDSVTKSWGKPDGVHEAMIRWQVFDKPQSVIEYSQLTEIALSTSVPVELHFAAAQQGMFFYCTACWINNRAKEGDFSAVADAIVP